MARALQGLRRYQEAPRNARLELMPEIANTHGAKLRDYGGEGRSVLFVPSLINPPNILDLSEGKSLLRWLAARGHRVLLLDWGWDSAGRSGMSVAGHVEQILVPLMQHLKEPPALVGYCLGGTMAVAAASFTKVRRLATIATPWHFSGFPDDARAMLSTLWRRSEAVARTLGVFPMEMLQAAFWSLDPARTVSKFEAFAAMDLSTAEARTFVTLEDWANDGPPVGEAAARELFEGFFCDDLPGSGNWEAGGKKIDPNNLPCPIFNVVSTTDRIVPNASAIRAGERLDLQQGHVGMVVGSRARESLWEPLDAWLRGQLATPAD